MYGYLADAVVILHVAYVGYVVLGQVAIIAAAPFKARWACNPWFRFTHLAAITIVAIEALMGWRCPLTVWEEQLRAMGGTVASSTGESFMGRLAHNLLFLDGLPEIFFNTLHVAFAVLVFQALLMYPPRWFRFSKGKPEGEPESGRVPQLA
jgi:hypothetical protein